jgi:hypothetical protein
MAERRRRLKRGLSTFLPVIVTTSSFLSRVSSAKERREEENEITMLKTHSDRRREV